MKLTPSNSVKAGAGIAALVVLLVIVGNAWGDYRAAVREQSVPNAESKEATKAPAEDKTETKPAAETPAAAPEKVVVVLIEGLSFRSSPNRSATRIAVLDKGQELEYLASEDGWYKARDGDGNIGYVSANKSYTALQEK